MREVNKIAMTQFNPENKATLTYGEALSPAMKITRQDDADRYKAAYMVYTNQFLKDGVSESGLTCEQIVNTNLGYYAGYYSDEVRTRVEKLFKCSHPVFGSIKENGTPKGTEAFKCGKEGKTLSEIRNA